MPVRLAASLRIAALLAILLAAPATAAPVVRGTVGGTSAILGGVKDGGLSLSLAAQWPLEYRGLGFETGFAGFADDFGSELEDLTDPATGGPAGQAEARHRAAYGAAYRLDALPFTGGAWEPFASGTWGIYRLRDDRLGDTLYEWSSTGWSLAAGVRRALRGRMTLGAEVRYHRMFNDRAGRYASAALEWGWR